MTVEENAACDGEFLLYLPNITVQYTGLFLHPYFFLFRLSVMHEAQFVIKLNCLGDIFKV